jgi:hypothetical protein
MGATVIQQQLWNVIWTTLYYAQDTIAKSFLALYYGSVPPAHDVLKFKGPNTIYRSTNLKNYESKGLLLQRA